MCVHVCELEKIANDTRVTQNLTGTGRKNIHKMHPNSEAASFEGKMIHSGAMKAVPIQKLL